ncbi:MAG: glycosyltransferase family 4 protein [Eubacteriales bacterium]|nr:glycosyltransferase family 4 protein [Eubacteriales bacterium]
MLYTTYYPAPAELRTRPNTMVVHYFAKALREMGHTVQVVFLSISRLPCIKENKFRDILPTEADYVYEGIPVHLFRTQELLPYLNYTHRFQTVYMNRQLRRLKKALGWKADKVFIHFPHVFTGMTEILADNVPVFGDFHNMDIAIAYKHYGRRVRRWYQRLDYWGYRNRRIYESLRMIEDRTMVPVYSGIDRSLLASEDRLQKKLEKKSNFIKILYAGQLIPLKNVDVLIEAVKCLPFECELTIIGDGEERERLQKIAEDSPRILFKGKLTREETVEQMYKHDVFIMLSSPETYGLVYLEALAQGCITVASIGEGFDGLIRDGENGFLAQPGSVDAAVNTLMYIYKMDEEQRQNMIQKGYLLAASMTEDQTAKQLLDSNQ